MNQEKNKKSSKIKQLISSQTDQQRIQYSIDINKLMKNELKDKIDYYIRKYRKVFNKRLGMNEDDMFNELREVVWKGLLSYQKEKNVKLRTFIHRCIDNYFKDKLDSLDSIKNNSVDYFADVFRSGCIDKEHTESEETGETVYLRREELMKNLLMLNALDVAICKDLMVGFGLQEMAERHSKKLHEIIAIINNIDKKVQERLKNCA